MSFKPLDGRLALVVDDEEFIRECLVDLFNRYGAKTFEAEDSIAGFEILKANKIDIVFSDVRIPSGGGLDLIHKISNSLSYRPAVFLCSGFSDFSKDQAKELGVVEIFDKPFDPKEVMELIVKKLSLVPK